MLTLFALPKAFQGRFRLIQENAIRSWTMLRPRPDIILLGDDPGTAEIARELGLRHVPGIERNEHGTPLANRVFQIGEQHAESGLLCYVNADIILMSDFMDAVRRADGLFENRPFLLIGRKSNVEIAEPLDFTSPDWESRLRCRVVEMGRYVTYDSDFFVYRTGTFGPMPGFAIGRCFWTQWLMFDAARRRVPVVDATPVVMSVESRHDYSHARSTGGARRLSGVEYESNRRLFRGCSYFTTADASLVLTADGLRTSPFSRKLLSLWVRTEYFVYFLLKGTLYPYSVPLVFALRGVKSCVDAVASLGRRLGRRTDTL